MAEKPYTDNTKASLFFVCGVVISTAMVWIIKTLGQDYGAFQILLARSAVTGLCLAPFLGHRFFKSGGFGQLTSGLKDGPSAWKLGSRSLLAFGGQAFGIAAIISLPIAQAQALSFTKGFIVLGLAVLVLREDVGLRRWLAMGIGFAGIMVAVQPSGAFEPAALYAIASAVCFAFSTIVMKQLTQQADNLTLMGWGAFAQSAMALPFALFGWVWPNLHDLGIMVCFGLVAIVLQNTMLAAYRIGDVSALSPLDYLRLITGMILGFFAFGEVPTPAILIGAGLIIVANLVASGTQAKNPNKRATNPAETQV